MASTLPLAPAVLVASEVYGDPGLHYARVEKAGDEPAPEPGVVDVAVLDMHHGYANLGHESIVDTLLEIARQERAHLPGAPDVRVLSYDVRAGCAVPAGLAGRFGVVVGTGGPGALDPRENDGVSEASQGIRESDAWEAPLFRFFDRVLMDPEVALLGICHSFGLMARWSGVAVPRLRTDAKGGKSMGVKGNVLTPAALEHPWFSGFARANGGETFRVLDSRLYDLVPTGTNTGLPLATEEGSAPETAGEAVTMLEFSRDEDGVGPRVWGVNFHPEIGDQGSQRTRLERLAERGEVTPAWVEERRSALDAWDQSDSAERGLQWTSSFTFEGPVRRVVARLLAMRRRPGK
jgi:GMP synthase-like glutamine amidotransferase